MARTKNALEIIDRLTGDDAELRAMIDEETINAQVAQMIFAARTQVGLTQNELAERIGTRQPVIARLEDADYAGHSLSMLQRVAAALGKSLEIRLLSSKRKRKTA